MILACFFCPRSLFLCACFLSPILMLLALLCCPLSISGSDVTPPAPPLSLSSQHHRRPSTLPLSISGSHHRRASSFLPHHPFPYLVHTVVILPAPPLSHPVHTSVSHPAPFHIQFTLPLCLGFRVSSHLSNVIMYPNQTSETF